MPAVTIAPADLVPFATIPEAKAVEMIADALSMATLVAPCIADEDFAHPGAAKAVIRGAILRWHDAGSGAVTQRSAGVYQETIDSTTRRNSMFWPSEIEQLQAMCRTAGDGGAFAVDTVGVETIQHAEICSLNFGSLYCSCGAILTQGLALWERDV